MAFRTDLAVGAIETIKEPLPCRMSRQSDPHAGLRRTTRYAFSQRMLPVNRQAAGSYLMQLDALIRREEDAFPRTCKEALSTVLRELLPHPNDGPVLICRTGQPYDNPRCHRSADRRSM